MAASGAARARYPRGASRAARTSRHCGVTGAWRDACAAARSVRRLALSSTFTSSSEPLIRREPPEYPQEMSELRAVSSGAPCTSRADRPRPCRPRRMARDRQHDIDFRWRAPFDRIARAAGGQARTRSGVRYVRLTGHRYRRRVALLLFGKMPGRVSVAASGGAETHNLMTTSLCRCISAARHP